MNGTSNMVQMDAMTATHLRRVIQSKRSMEEAMNVKIAELDASMESLKRFVLVLNAAFDEFEELREMQSQLAEQSGCIDAQIQKLLSVSVHQNEEVAENEHDEGRADSTMNDKSEDEYQSEPQSNRSRSRTRSKTPPTEDESKSQPPDQTERDERKSPSPEVKLSLQEKIKALKRDLSQSPVREGSDSPKLVRKKKKKSPPPPSPKKSQSQQRTSRKKSHSRSFSKSPVRGPLVGTIPRLSRSTSTDKNKSPVRGKLIGRIPSLSRSPSPDPKKKKKKRRSSGDRKRMR